MRISDIEGKATRVGASERGQRTSFNDVGSERVSMIRSLPRGLLPKKTQTKKEQ